MHHTEAYRVPKIAMNTGNQNYREKLSEAQNYMEKNPSIFGYSPIENLTVKESVNEYGAPTKMPQDVKNPDNGFAQIDHPSNSVSVNPLTTTGSVGLGTSGSLAANESPSVYQSDALERRLKAYTEAQGNSKLNLNDLSQTGTLA